MNPRLKVFDLIDPRFAHERHDRARIQPARQVGAEGDVANQLFLDRPAKVIPDAFLEKIVRLSGFGLGSQPEIPIDPDVSVFEQQKVGGRKPSNAVEQRAVAGDVTQVHEIVDGLEVRLSWTPLDRTGWI